jgi:putative ABC transport system substrate-binding protein
MRRRTFIAGLGSAAAWPRLARAQQGAAKRIGVLMPESEGGADTNAQVVVFENTFKQLGWIPRRNLQIDYRWAMGDMQRMRALAADLVNSASGHRATEFQCPLSGVKRTFGSAGAMSANDPERTSG